MKKRLLAGCILGMLSVAGLCWAEDIKAAPCDTAVKSCTGVEQYKNTRAALDYIADTLIVPGVKYSDARVSPMIRAEEWYEIPLEIGFLTTETKLVPTLEKLLAFSFADAQFVSPAIAVSVTANIVEGEGQPLLAVNLNTKMFCGSTTKENKAACSKSTRRFARALANLLKLSTFKPQVPKQVDGGKTGPGTTWLTNLRIDGDGRLQITGYALDVKEVTRLGDALLTSGTFLEVYISSMSKNTYEKVPVWRFDILAKIN